MNDNGAGLVMVSEGRRNWSVGWGRTEPEMHGLNQALGNKPTSQNQWDAMFSLADHFGLRNFLQSSVLRFHHQGLHHDAAAAFAAWDDAGGHVMGGVVARRAREARLYLTPDGED